MRARRVRIALAAALALASGCAGSLPTTPASEAPGVWVPKAEVGELPIDTETTPLPEVYVPTAAVRGGAPGREPRSASRGRAQGRV